MRQLIDWLLQNPILIFILVASVSGMIGNIGKAAKKAQQRGAATPPVRRPPAWPAGGGQGQGNAPRTAEEVAAEIRRALGLDPTPSAPPAPRPQPKPEPRPVVRRDVVTPERPPTPVVPTTQARRLQMHVDPHVGEAIGKGSSIGRRSSLRSAGATHRAMGQLGGGRQHAQDQEVARRSRFALGDLGRALVLNEILGPPLALREPRSR